METAQTFDPCARLKESQRYGKASLKFEREQRDCPANDRLGNGASGGRFIYDWRVIIDGAHRCTFKKTTVGNRESFGGYQLFDCEGRPIRTIRENMRGSHWPPHFGTPVQQQSEFAACIQTLLYEMAIPSIREQMAETQRLGIADSALRAACEVEAQDYGISQHARALFDALAEMIELAEDSDYLARETRNERIEKARAAFHAAHTRGAECINAEREFSQIYLSKRR